MKKESETKCMMQNGNEKNGTKTFLHFEKMLASVGKKFLFFFSFKLPIHSLRRKAVADNVIFIALYVICDFQTAMTFILLFISNYMIWMR